MKDELVVGAIDTTLMFRDCSKRVALATDNKRPRGQNTARTKEALAPRAAGNSSEPLEMETVAVPVAGSKDLTVTRSGDSESDDAGKRLSA
jgi:hypothetical protein